MQGCVKGGTHEVAEERFDECKTFTDDAHEALEPIWRASACVRVHSHTTSSWCAYTSGWWLDAVLVDGLSRQITYNMRSKSERTWASLSSLSKSSMDGIDRSDERHFLAPALQPHRLALISAELGGYAGAPHTVHGSTGNTRWKARCGDTPTSFAALSDLEDEILYLGQQAALCGHRLHTGSTRGTMTLSDKKLA